MAAVLNPPSHLQPDQPALPRPLAPAPHSELVLVSAFKAQLAPVQSLVDGANAQATSLSQAMTGAALDTLALKLLAAFPLSSPEGLALMRMTEALLRVPDAASAKALLRAELHSAPWQARSGGLVAQGAAFALKTGAALMKGEGSLSRAVSTLALALGKRFVRHFGSTFVFGETIALAAARMRSGGAYSFDMLGEQALNAHDVQRFEAAYAQAIDCLGPLKAAGADVNVSIKLSALHPRYNALQTASVVRELVPRVAALVRRARKHGLAVTIDAEEAARLELSLEVFQALSAEHAGWDGLGLAVQAYQTRAMKVLERVVEIAKRDGRRISVRLVKGAYWDSEIKRAQSEGLAEYPVFTAKAHTDVSYLACADFMLRQKAHLFSAFATHNACSFAAVRALAEHHGLGTDYEFQCLHGMGEPLYDAARGQRLLGVPARIYAPVGAFDALLPYLVRRLLENGANTSFLAQLGQAQDGPAAAPSSPISLPVALFPGRKNSSGVDFGSAREVKQLSAHRADLEPVADSSQGQVDAAIATARAAQDSWRELGAAARASRIRAWGDALEAQLGVLCALAVGEAGKTWPNAVADVREAVDFCRYYADLAAFDPAYADAAPLGTVAAISPWNFPLAIFVGQVAAALAAGNTVVAKPAVQTPLMALKAREIALAVDIPAQVLQLVVGGAAVGARLSESAGIDALLFTGSLGVAKHIEAHLNRRACPFIAETSGLNAMIVDSTALIDQAVLDIVGSAFDSAGQRCSALRLLWVQDDIADRLIEALKGAMAELRVGDPHALDTDIGPVIDGAALARLRAHEARLQSQAKLIARVELDQVLEGHYFAPCAYEVSNLDLLAQETFGPVLHIHRFKASELDQCVTRTAGLGYALTGGMQSRIRTRLAAFAQSAPAGNVYLNRNTIGAVVGSQPFGGSRKSGTGPKAGGPWALARLMRNAKPSTALFGSQQNERLPGVTGEKNLRSLHARGAVACTGPGDLALAAQLAFCKTAGLEGFAARGVDWYTRADLGAVLMQSWDADLALALGNARADIANLVCAQADGSYPLWRLLDERSVSDNIAAAGGNVELLVGAQV